MDAVVVDDDGTAVGGAVVDDDGKPTLKEQMRPPADSYRNAVTRKLRVESHVLHSWTSWVKSAWNEEVAETRGTHAVDSGTFVAEVLVVVVVVVDVDVDADGSSGAQRHLFQARQIQ